MTSICGPNEALKRPINCEIIYYEIAQKMLPKVQLTADVRMLRQRNIYGHVEMHLLLAYQHFLTIMGLN